MPWHPRCLTLVQFILLPLLHVCEITNAVIVEILTGPDLSVNTLRVTVRERVVMYVVASKAKIEASDESDFIIYNNALLMVSPVHCHVRGILEDVVVGMSHNAHVRAQSVECVLGMSLCGKLVSE